MLRLSVLLLFHSFVSEATNDEFETNNDLRRIKVFDDEAANNDFACGSPKHSLSAVANLRSGGARPGQDTSMIEFPWIVQLLYSGSNRQCAGSLISDRHVLTARRCVDQAGPSERRDAVLEPKEISVLYGNRQKYGGMMKVKAVRTYDAKLAKGSAGDLAVLELEKAVEFSDVARPICLANTFDEKTQNTVFGLHFGNKKRPEDDELTRPLYFDVHYASDRKNCEESLGGHFHKDEFCISKRNQVFGEGIHVGAPIMTPNNEGGRWVQVGISLESTKENNYGSATRVDLYDKIIQELTHCYINGSGVGSRPSGQKQCQNESTTKTTTTTTPTTTTTKTTPSTTTPTTTTTTTTPTTTATTTTTPTTTASTTPTTTVHQGQSKLIPGGTKKANFKDAEAACLALHGTLPRAKNDDERRRVKGEIPAETGSVDSRVWLLNDDPRDKSDITQAGYVHCFALSNTDGEVAEVGCDEEHAVVCEVATEAGVCDKDGDVYYKDEKDDAYCYKIIYESKDDPVRTIYENDMVDACRSAGAGEAGFVHSPQEHHVVALMFREKFEADERYNCLRLGVFFDESSGESSLHQVVDGSAFDFGAHPNGTVPKCGSNPGYPWCGGEPNCEGDETSLFLMPENETHESLDCWDDGLAVYSCSVVCKKKLH